VYISGYLHVTDMGRNLTTLLVATRRHLLSARDAAALVVVCGGGPCQPSSTTHVPVDSNSIATPGGTSSCTEQSSDPSSPDDNKPEMLDNQGGLQSTTPCKLINQILMLACTSTYVCTKHNTYSITSSRSPSPSLDVRTATCKEIILQCKCTCMHHAYTYGIISHAVDLRFRDSTSTRSTRPTAVKQAKSDFLFS
jgi:hypothetical protein